MGKTINELYGGVGYTQPTLTEWAEHSGVADLDNGRKFKSTQLVPMKTLADESTTNVQYIGFTQFGVNATLPLWRIFRALTTNSIQYLEAADGDDKFDNSWSSRASLSYS